MKHDMNYNSKFVLYVSTCSGCGENRIAESNIKLHERMTLNRLAGLNSHLQEHKCAALPVEQSSHWERCAQIEIPLESTVFLLTSSVLENHEIFS